MTNEKAPAPALTGPERVSATEVTTPQKEQSMSNTIIPQTADAQRASREERDRKRAQLDAEIEAAQAADCEFRVVGCDGDYHTPLDPEELWIHRVGTRVFASSIGFGDVSIELNYLSTNGEFRASVNTTTESEFSAAEIREHAEHYADYPAFMRAVADRLEALNKIMGK